MSDSQNMSDEVRARLRAIPSVNELLTEWPVVKAAGETCDAVVHAAVTAELDEERAAIRAGAARALSASWPRPSSGVRIALRCRACVPPSTPRVWLSIPIWVEPCSRSRAAKAVAEAARGYSTLEYSVDTCSRVAQRSMPLSLIRSLTGAEDALVVNNNAAAVLLVLATTLRAKRLS